jgi:fumarylacetoacetase
VTLEALELFGLPCVRPAGDPQLLPYLGSSANRTGGVFNVELEVWLQTPAMRVAGRAGQRISCSNFSNVYWTLSQLVAHHIVGGCNLRSGDLLGTGTLLGPAPEQGGSLLELTKGGQEVLKLDNGETGMFLEDCDTVFFVDTVGTLVQNASVLGRAVPRCCPHAQKVFYEEARSITTRATVGKPARLAL